MYCWLVEEIIYTIYISFDYHRYSYTSYKFNHHEVLYITAE